MTCRLLLSLLLPASFSLGCSAPAAKDSVPTDTANSALEAVIEQYKVLNSTPGVAIAVIKDGKAVLAKGFGSSNLELEAKVSPETVFQIGSLTKPFTAGTVMVLKDQGKLKLEDPITKYLPDLPDYCKAVTLRHMLTHTSGIPNYNSQPGFMKMEMAGISVDDVLNVVKQNPATFKPSEKWEYSNTNYWLLGLVIAQVSGKGYGEALNDLLLGPSGMSASGLLMHGKVVPHRANGYMQTPQGWANARLPIMTGPFAAGGMSASLKDLVAFDSALDKGSPLSPAMVQEMIQPTKLTGGGFQQYGFGWSMGSFKGEPFLGGGGGVPGFKAVYRRYLNRKFSVIVLANSAGASIEGLLDSLSDGVSDAQPRTAPP